MHMGSEYRHIFTERINLYTDKFQDNLKVPTCEQLTAGANVHNFKYGFLLENWMDKIFLNRFTDRVVRRICIWKILKPLLSSEKWSWQSFCIAVPCMSFKCTLNFSNKTLFSPLVNRKQTNIKIRDRHISWSFC